jgi:NAD(P)H-hydrate epimerase
VVIVHYKENFSADAEENYKRLLEKYPTRLVNINSEESLKEIQSTENSLAIDALLGTGTNKAVTGLLEETINFINQSFTKIISVDVPSGLLCEESSKDLKSIVHSTLTLTFQLPKLAFLVSENQNYVPEFEILNIHLDEQEIANQQSPYFYLTKNDVRSLLRPRSKFSHKGSFGHALLLAGSKGKSGAAIISAKASLRSGAGLLSLHSTKDTLAALLNHLPEAMAIEDSQTSHISEIDKPENYTAIAFGPGTGTEEETQLVLKKILHYYTGKLVIDADGLNILAENKTWLTFLPKGTILTPHPKEFERLTEKHDNDFDRLKALKHFSLKHGCIVILKGAHSAIAMPDGSMFFNSTGNAGLAKGGSGDGLTGIILGLLARGYNAAQASIIGTFMHGYAADLCVKKKSKESLLISDVIDMLPKAFAKVESL